MILISTIIFLLNLISFIFLIRYGNMIIIILQIISLLGLIVYYFIKTKRKYIKGKLILYLFLLSIIQILMFIVFYKCDIVIFPNDLNGALNSIVTICLFCIIDITFVIILLASNLIKYLLNKMDTKGIN